MPSFFLLSLIFTFLVSVAPLKFSRGSRFDNNSGPTRLSFAKRINSTSIRNVLKADRARAAARMARFGIHPNSPIHPRDSDDVTIDNQAVMYVASVGVGSPATTYSLIVDIGSSNTWIGAGKPYVRTGSSVQTSDRVSVTYGSGSFSGTEFTDTVSIGPFFAFRQSIGVATTSAGFEGVDGILGLGPEDLTEDTLSPDTNSEIPTAEDNIFSGCGTDSDTIGIYFEPTTSAETVNGELTLGGSDFTRFLPNSEVFIPLTTTSPSNQFWGINQSIRYGTSASILSNTAGIFDTGTTLLLIADDALTRYIKATGAVFDQNTGLLRLTSSQFASLQSLFFTMNGVTFEFTANAQAWPRVLNTLIGGTTGNVYLIVNSIGTNTGSGLDFINGLVFLERFYTVYDTTNKRIGIGPTAFTSATTN